jgi:hypothetical protein
MTNSDLDSCHVFVFFYRTRFPLIEIRDIWQTFCNFVSLNQRSHFYFNEINVHKLRHIYTCVIKDEVLITVSCPIFPSILIAKYLFTGSLKYRSIDNLETQKKYIFQLKIPNSLIIYSMQNRNKLEIKF